MWDFRDMKPKTSSSSANQRPLPNAQGENLLVSASYISDDTLLDAEDRFWNEFCSSPKTTDSTSSSVGNSQNRLLQVLQHLDQKD